MMTTRRGFLGTLVTAAAALTGLRPARRRYVLRRYDPWQAWRTDNIVVRKQLAAVEMTAEAMAQAKAKALAAWAPAPLQRAAEGVVP